MSSTIEVTRESKCDDDGKNNSKICCQFCPSIILNPKVATVVSREFPLPLILKKKNDDQSKSDASDPSSIEKEDLKDYWKVDDIIHFENVSVTNTVDQLKYLGCADCELGPIGFHDLTTKVNYIALSRVMYKD